MRLLECVTNGELRLTEDLSDDKTPLYAILSHTWGPDTTEEVTFKDIVDDTGKGEKGYGKLEFCAKHTRRDGLRFVWVDTYYINKSTSDELQALINSMFQ